MPDFSHLKRYAVTEETTAEYTFDRIEGDPSIIMAPAADCNPVFQREKYAIQLAIADKTVAVQKGNKTSALTPEDIIKGQDEEREQDRKLLAHTCAKAWGTPPKDAKGKDVEFSAENAYAFFAALPPEMFDPLRGFAQNLYNFWPERQFASDDGASLGNSSAEG